jgi:hypothetical protein
VHDVSKGPRYLAGSTLVKSEIVVPIYVNKALAGDLDIESYFADTFNKSEQEFAQANASVIADYLARQKRAPNRFFPPPVTGTSSIRPACKMPSGERR